MTRPDRSNIAGVNLGFGEGGVAPPLFSFMLASQPASQPNDECLSHRDRRFVVLFDDSSSQGVSCLSREECCV